jgi:ubiquinone/menaquinone biosynthesis C-methylase UbiE
MPAWIGVGVASKDGSSMRFILETFANQLRLPTGFLGKIVGRAMARGNRPIMEWTLHLLQIEPTDLVLEIGFGPGVGIQIAARMASQGHVAGIDLSETMINAASNLNSKEIASGRVELRYGDATSLPYENETFDKLFAANVLYFWEDPSYVLGEMNRVIKPGGRIALTFVDKEHLDKQKKLIRTVDFASYDSDDVLELLTRAGFSQARSETTMAARPTRRFLCALAEK